MKHLVAKLSLGCLLALLTVSCGSKKEGQTQTDLPQYELRTLKPESRTINYSYPATLEGGSEIDVFPQVEGRLTATHYTGNGLVKKGQVIATVDPTTARLEVQTAQSNVKVAQVAVNNARMEYNSEKNLFDKGIVSALVLQRAQNALNTAEAQLAQAKTAVSIARTSLSHCNVIAPISGTIKGNNDKVGMLVSPSMAGPIATISDQRVIKAKFSINETLYLSIFEDQQVINTEEGLQAANGKTVNDVYDNIHLKLKDGTTYSEKGKFDELGATIDKSTGSVQCSVVFDNPDNLLHSGSAATIVFPYTLRDALIIPQTAAKKLQNKYLVYRVNKQGCAEGIVVDVMPTDDNKEFIVLNGLQKGDQIVANGVARIQEGQQVSLSSK